MAEIKDFNKAKKKKSHKKLIIKIAIVLLVLGAVVTVYVFRKSPFIVSIRDFFSDGFSGYKKGDGYPADLPGGTMVEIDNMGNDVLLLTDTDLTFYNNSGAAYRQVKHGKTVPRMSANKNMAVVYDVGGKGVSVESKSKTVFSKSMEHNIIIADISQNDLIAVVTESSKYFSELSVYDAVSGEIVFQLMTSEETICDVGFSADGSKIGVSLIKTIEGELVSTVSVFNLKSDVPLFKTAFVDQLIFNVNFMQNDYVVATGDFAVSFIDASGQIVNEHSFNAQQFISFSNESYKYHAVLINDLTMINNYFVNIYDEKGTLVSSSSFDNEVFGICCGDSYAVAMTQNGVKSITIKNQTVKDVYSGIAVNDVILCSDTVYAITSDSIVSFSAK